MHDSVIALERQGRSIPLRNVFACELFEAYQPWNVELLRLKSCVCAHMIDHRMPQEHENLRMAIHRALKAPLVVRVPPTRQPTDDVSLPLLPIAIRSRPLRALLAADETEQLQYSLRT
jgi:hypothetical protein